MRRIYRLPIMGGVKNDQPLTGVVGNPLCNIPLGELPNFDTLPEDEKEYSLANLEYNVDEEWCDVEIEAGDAFHEWLLGLMPNIRTVAKDKGWKLDKTELEKAKKARELEKR